MTEKNTKKEWSLTVRMHDAVRLVGYLAKDAENPKDFWLRAYYATEPETRWMCDFEDVYEAVRLIKYFYDSYTDKDCKNCPLHLTPKKLPKAYYYGHDCLYRRYGRRLNEVTQKEREEAIKELMGNRQRKETK